MKNLLLPTLLLLSFFSFAQVGIGTTSPDAILHIVGTTVLSGGGTTTLLTDGFEDSSLAPFTTSGDVTWQTTTNAAEINSGSFSARTRTSLADSQSSTLQYITTITTTGTVDFAVTTSTEATWDTLTFFIDGVSQQVWSGINAYATVSYPLTTGAHTLTWTYDKDGTSDGGNDRVAIDDVLITETSAGGGGSYTFRLEDGQEQAGYVLTSDANGNGTWQVASGGSGAGTDDQTIDVFSLSGTTLSLSLEGDGAATQTVDLSGLGGGGSYSFENGITETSGTVRLGGLLTQGTTINLDDNDLTFSSSKTVAFPGEIILEGTDRDMMITNFDDEYVVFGTSSFLSTTIDGTSFTDSGGDPYTIDVALGVYTGNSGGSGFKMGSIEYLTDGLGELFVTHDFSPLDDNSNSSGTAAHRWDRVFATNGTIQTSDLRLKKKIKKLNYGLDEIMQLQTITYNWKKEQKGNTVIPEHLQERKIGFSAQQLLKVLPETVNTHSWVAADEKGTFKRIENKNLGVFYSDIIPVTVKAIQEQQEMIKDLKSEISELKLLVKTFIQEKK